MADNKDGLRYTIQFNRNDPRHLQAAKVLSLKGLRSKAVYLTEAILHYENCGAVPDTNGVELTALIESIVISILSQERNRRTPPSPAQIAYMDKPIIAPDTGDRVKVESVDVERAMRELGEDGVRSIANTMAKLRGK